MGTYDTRGGTPRHDPAFDMHSEPSEFELDTLALVEKIEALQEESRQAEKALADKLLEAMRALIPAGSRLVKFDRSKPWSSWSTWSGNDRNAREIEIIEVKGVSIDHRRPIASKWTAEAYAISPTTGQRMSGSTSNGSNRGRGTILVRGEIVREPHTDARGDAYRQECSDALSRVLELAANAISMLELERALKGD